MADVTHFAEHRRGILEVACNGPLKLLRIVYDVESDGYSAIWAPADGAEA